ncbi:MAG: hypothetical protein WDA08_04695 [Weeksellaceae bacterium]
MKYTTIIGIMLIAIGFVASFIGNIEFIDMFPRRMFWLGIIYGGGLGILVGGFLGWLYKKNKKIVEKTKNEVTEPEQLQ